MVCGKECVDTAFGSHLKKHNLKTFEYYDKYLKTDPSDGFCKFCGKPTTFRGISFGYSDYHKTCVAKDPNIQKKKKENFLSLPEEEQLYKKQIKVEKYKNTCLEKFGQDNYFKTEEFQVKRKDTCLEKFGVDHWAKLLTGKTNSEFYGYEKAKIILNFN